MQTTTSQPTPYLTSDRPRKGMPLIVVIAVLALLAGIWQVFDLSIKQISQNKVQPITAAQLEATYGMRIRLVGVTAAGGMIDVRFKILDPLKAEILLKNPDSLPKLVVGDTVLATDPPDLESLVLEEGGIVFMLFPNRGGVVTPGAPVTITFGDLQLEAVTAQ